ncbi:MAG TPA: iron donor protein CyaY [Polyangiaceae bacterium]|jgi:CyaY protein
MDESTYQRLADAAFRAIGDAFEDVDTDLVDCETAGDVVTLTLRGGKRCVVNTQRPARQIWLAANAQAWHFSWDEASKRWVDDRGRGEDLFATIARIVKEGAGAEITFG